MMNDNPTIDPKIAEARRAIEADRLDNARSLLRDAARQAPEDPRPWLLLAGIAATPRERRAYLDQARRLEAQPAPPAGATASPRRRRRTSTRPPRPLGWALALLAVLLLVVGAAFTINPDGRAMVNDMAGRVPVLSWLVAPELPTAAAPAGPISTVVADSGPSQVEPPAPSPTNPPVFPTKDIAPGGDSPLPTWTPAGEPTPTLAPTMTPSPTPEPLPTAEPIPLSLGAPVSRPAGVGEGERWISVNLSTQTLVAFEGDIPVFETLVSSGLPQWPTVTGLFRTYMKYESQTMNGYLLGYDYYLPDVPYVMYFFEDYAIHGTYWHSNFGQPMSHGCVNVSTPDAEWLFNWAPVGTLVDVTY